MTAPLITDATTIGELAELLRAADVRVNLAPLSAGHPGGSWEAHVSGPRQRAAGGPTLRLARGRVACRRPRRSADRVAAVNWNPHFVAFAVAHGWTPEEAAHRLRLREYRPMDGHAWIALRRTEWRALRGLSAEAAMSDEARADFCGWLLGTAIAIREAADERGSKAGRLRGVR